MLPGEPREKRKATEGHSGETPRKRPLNDAFESLSLQNTLIRAHQAVIQNADSRAQRTQHPDRNNFGDTIDVSMKDPSSYSRDAHTVVVNSLDSDSDTDAQEEEEDAKFLFNLPGPIDTTFSGTKGIPENLLAAHTANKQVVLYQGTPEQVVGRSMTDNRKNESIEKSPRLREMEARNIEYPEDSMDLD